MSTETSNTPSQQIDRVNDTNGVPPLCECDDFGSICQTCKIALDKITNSRSNLPPAPLPSSGDETMTQNLLSSSNFLCSECGKGFEKNWMPKRKDIYQFECKSVIVSLEAWKN